MVNSGEEDFFGQGDSQAGSASATPRFEPAAGPRGPRPRPPLAERMRPVNFDQWIGQQAVAGAGSPLRRMLEQGQFPSLIFWGPPGCGKTTLARLVAACSDMHFTQLSAVTSGVKQVKEVIELAKGRLTIKGRRTLLFIDEIHRFNKAQQDAFLPHVEDGTIVLIGATTENPSFSVIAPLLSRCRVLTLSRLNEEEIQILLQAALNDRERGLGAQGWQAEPKVLEQIAALSDGDARRALGLLEQCTVYARAHMAAQTREQAQATAEEDKIEEEAQPQEQDKVPADAAQAGPWLTAATLKAVLDRDRMVYDKSGEEHFNLISAFHKSMRASDPQGAVYWLFRMLAAGEDPLWIARRILCVASEDIGMADPQALSVAVAAMQSFQAMGLPEGELPLTHATIYMATAPKSNSVVTARYAAKEFVAKEGPLPVPLHLRNAPTGLLKQLGYGREYQYDHDCPDHFSGQPTLPDKLAANPPRFYEPGNFGFEREVQKRMDWWDQKRKERQG